MPTLRQKCAYRMLYDGDDNIMYIRPAYEDQPATFMRYVWPQLIFHLMTLCMSMQGVIRWKEPNTEHEIEFHMYGN